MKSQSVIVTVIVILLGANALAWLAVFELSKPQYLEVSFFDVGQGDAIFIETPQGNQILIDGGPSSVVLEKLGREMPFWDRTIDLVILTHPEHDHIAGLIEVLKSYKVKNILWTGVVRESAEYGRWMKFLLEENASVFWAEAGQKISCTECRKQSWGMRVLFPFQNMVGEKMERANNSSVVIKLQSGETSFLLTGDIEGSVEGELVFAGADLSSDILKVAHHGSKTSSIPEFVGLVSPEFSVISAGKDNRYGHPHSQTLETLRGYVPNILRTDTYGDIKFITDGKRLQLR